MNKISTIISSVPAALTALGNMEKQVKAKATYTELRKVMREADAIKALFKEVGAVKQKAEWVVLLSHKRIGEELEAVPPGYVAGSGRGKKGVRQAAKTFSGKAQTGIPKDTRSRQKKIKQKSDDELREAAEQLWADGKDATLRGVLSADRLAIKQGKRQAAIAAIFSAEGPFDVVVIDPPWEMQKIDRDDRPNQDAFGYDTMSLAEIEAFWVDKIEVKTKPDCHVFCWTTQKYLPEALKIIDRLGYRYVLTMVWHKPGGFQPNDLPQYNCEFAVYARKGSPLFVDTRDFFVCNSWPRREHSRKPQEFYQLIKRVTGGSRLDVFARERHEGFAQFGKEIDKFIEAAQ